MQKCPAGLLGYLCQDSLTPVAAPTATDSALSQPFSVCSYSSDCFSPFSRLCNTPTPVAAPFLATGVKAVISGDAAGVCCLVLLWFTFKKLVTAALGLEMKE